MLFVFRYLSVWQLPSNFAEKAEKRHMPLSVTLETNHSTEEMWGWEAGTWLFACCNGTERVTGRMEWLVTLADALRGRSLWAVRTVVCVLFTQWRWEIWQEVTNVLVIILSLWSGYNPWQAAPETSHMSYFPTLNTRVLETTSFRHPLNVLHINQMWQCSSVLCIYI